MLIETLRGWCVFMCKPSTTGLIFIISIWYLYQQGILICEAKFLSDRISQLKKPQCRGTYVGSRGLTVNQRLSCSLQFKYSGVARSSAAIVSMMYNGNSLVFEREPDPPASYEYQRIISITNNGLIRKVIPALCWLKQDWPLFHVAALNQGNPLQCSVGIPCMNAVYRDGWKFIFS